MFGGRSKRADLERSSVFDLGMKPIRRHLMMLVSWTCHSMVALRDLLYLCFLMLILAFDFVFVFLTWMRLMRMLMAGPEVSLSGSPTVSPITAATLSSVSLASCSSGVDPY